MAISQAGPVLKCWDQGQHIPTLAENYALIESNHHNLLFSPSETGDSQQLPQGVNRHGEPPGPWLGAEWPKDKGIQEVWGQ